MIFLIYRSDIDDVLPLALVEADTVESAVTIVGGQNVKPSTRHEGSFDFSLDPDPRARKAQKVLRDRDGDRDGDTDEYRIYPSLAVVRR